MASTDDRQVFLRDLPPLTTLDKETRISFELERVEDLYANAVVELKLPRSTAVVDTKKKTDIGWYSFQKKKLVFCMVGLPARGKTFLARKMCRYLKWVGVSTRVFNVGAYRRERLGSNQPADFFDPFNEAGSRQRLHMAVAALDDMLKWLDEGGRVAIYDATNSTKQRRSLVVKRCVQENLDVIFIESICNDSAIIEKNIRETKLFSPDYLNKDPDRAVEDFTARIHQYQKVYESVDDSESVNGFVKIIDVGKQVIVHGVEGYLASRVIYFLMNVHIVPRPIWLTRHGESEYNALGKLGGDSGLTSLGETYAHALADWVDSHLPEGEKLTVWTSALKRTISTAQYMNHPKIALKALNEIDAGVCDGMTYDEIAERMPEEYAARVANKLHYRYPQGESYMDVIQRLEPIIFELERQKSPVLVVTHQAIMRALYAYFMDLDPEECPHLPSLLHTVYQLTPKAYGCDLQTFKLD